MPRLSSFLCALAALLLSGAENPAQEKTAKPEEQAKDVCEQFWKAISTRDLEGAVKLVAEPWYDNQDNPGKPGRVTRGTEEVKQRLKKIFGAYATAKVETVEVFHHHTYDQAAEKLKGDARKMLEVLQKTDRVLSCRLTVVGTALVPGDAKKRSRVYVVGRWVNMSVGWRAGQAKVVGIHAP